MQIQTERLKIGLNKKSKPIIELIDLETNKSVLRLTNGGRRLQARYTLEAAQDLHAMHGVDIEAEMLRLLNEEISLEIMRQYGF